MATRRKEATIEEAQEVWQSVCAYWDRLSGKIDFPWVEANFKLGVFKTTLEQRGLRLPEKMAP